MSYKHAYKQITYPAMEFLTNHTHSLLRS